MSLEVIGAGFGRTGTYTIKLALEHLGFSPCYHMYEVRTRPELLRPWEDALNGSSPRWEQVFAGYRAQMDWPAAAYWKDLAEAFPQAKVILSVRDPEEWYASISATILPSVTVGLAADEDAFSRAASEMIFHTVHERVFGGRLADKDAAISIYKAHIEDVKAHIPSDRLLVYNVAAGWRPLCDFLGKDVPALRFPHTNSTQDFLRRKPHLQALTPQGGKR
ncbi:sulfotransferase family protein [Rhodobacterales bacterium HKCCSP123]|nr:sulfotransferase family protein [Rhodobacterales bacterium HKCCSP123]